MTEGLRGNCNTNKLRLTATRCSRGPRMPLIGKGAARTIAQVGGWASDERHLGMIVVWERSP